ncbi:type II toxin-antitoxin system VapC family toxin [Tessaracoccus sp. MC1865]|uniref:type II toxin-antitoxin system VapC family toxin n=1 Tax=Tessaracoccus sp. MC1865 TaxID=2760310 RepID=UPI0016041EF0|nr:type II toxin-antitoxin system VapC family toxin [Tessaracoccus sp. MC1865]MBB1482632.1 type II toxin-antitoxin system VapC family toxin [Tessaracoccus sp. MC1865]QTO37917.1 type II toxin-antitoxin system VapC family toxin [Tessaracoccus sp. MC1865]
MSERVRIYVDSNIYCDLLGKNKERDKDSGQHRWIIAKKVFDAVNDDRIILCASSLIEAEVLCLGDVRNKHHNLERVREWFRAPATEWTEVDRFLAREAGRLAKEWKPYMANPDGKLGGADATHLAAAIRLKCDFLMTHDEAFPLGHDVEGVRVMRPDVVWPEHLMDEGISGAETMSRQRVRQREAG